MTVSVTHDFVHVVELNIQQLENPVALQLGTVGSRSMINFGVRTNIEFGPISENNVYVDVININRYDMIISTPFMRKHWFILDFSNDTLSAQGHLVPTMSSGQEDLMLAKKHTMCAHTPTNAGRPSVHALH